LGVDTEDPHLETPPRRGRPPSPALEVTDLQGFKFFQRMDGLLTVLHSSAPHRNRLLHFDGVFAA